MKQILYSIILFLIIVPSWAQQREVDSIIKEFKNPTGKQVLVAAHRGDWRNAPENSLAAIRLAIEMGVDIVEIDVQRTKDGHLVLMHDQTIDRTTDGKGHVMDMTLDSLRKLHLRNGLGRVTYHQIPTLEEALQVAKGKVMLNLDKCYEFINDAYPILERTGTIDHVIFKGYYLSADQVKKENGVLLDKLFYMAMVKLDDPNARKVIDDFQSQLKPVAFELSFTRDTSSLFSYFTTMKKRGSRIWINSLWASLNGGHDDDRSETDLKGSYEWLIEKGANVIQTDRPKELLSFLRARKLHR
ncbi:glycerophosphodiester phosphodiesterase family protein [Xanthocytophaga flava]|uniref:glycerophosphodiester phosphodiesterase family protein n=1 Tax=Xanthocytophaga flava TaxID=3048013 RepID=UPI0028D32021|nr:glycerophosphodiester phosphodiesterase family protein [Xanthocytophaga flavus]MDJ1470299.1 glycerophosphodiester phosphodiesterase family protein [Xanthocytophaga flavus]